MAETCTADQKDLAARKLTSLLAWGPPAAALIASAFLPSGYFVVVWPVSLLWMGTSCLVNVFRCGRLHCYFTGPFFLLLAAFSLLHGLEIVPLGAHGWRWLGLTLVAGTVILGCLPERVWGKYASRAYGMEIEGGKRS